LDVSINHRITWTAIAETVLQLPKLAGLGVSNVTEEEVQVIIVYLYIYIILKQVFPKTEKK